MDEMSAWGAWGWWGAGWSLIALAGVVVLWALFWDRPRGRRRCPACWYDMGGGGLSCPECGVTLPSERALTRTHRRWWGIALAAVPAFAGTQFIDWPNRAWEAGWTKYVPTTVLALLASRDADGLLGKAVDEALMTRPMWGWQGAVAEWRILEVMDQDRAAMVTTRRVWPVGAPVVLRPDLGAGVAPRFSRGALEVSAAGRTTAIALEAWGECGCCCEGDDDERVEEDRLVLDGRGPGKYVERVTVRVKSRGWTIASWDTDVAFEVAGTIDDVVKPLSTPDLDACLRRSLRIEEYPVETGVLYALWVAMDDATPGADGGCSGGPWSNAGSPPLKGDVLVDGTVAAYLHRGDSFRAVWEDYVEPRDDLRGCLVRVPLSAGAAGTPLEDRDPNVLVAYAREHVRLRLTGDQRAALDEFGSAAYWSGTMEISLADVLGTE